MKRYMTGILTLIILAFMLISIQLWGAHPIEHQVHNKKPSRKLQYIFPELIETGYPVRRDFSMRLSWFGRVKSKREIKVMSLVAGKVVTIKVSDGASVQKGDILFILGGNQVTHMIKKLRQHVLSMEEQERILEESVSLKQESVSARIEKKESLLLARQHLRQIKENLFVAREELRAFKDKLLIRSPMDGIFVNRQVSTGQDVKQGTYLADLISPDLYITAHLFPPDGTSLIGRTAIIPMVTGPEITGTIVRVLPRKTAEGATVIWIESTGINNILRPEEKVSGWIVLEMHKGAIAVPQDALVYDEQGHAFVFVKKDNVYKKTAVKTGLKEDGWWEILSGLSDRDRIVIHGAYELFYRGFKKIYKVPD